MSVCCLSFCPSEQWHRSFHLRCHFRVLRSDYTFSHTQLMLWLKGVKKEETGFTVLPFRSGYRPLARPRCSHGLCLLLILVSRTSLASAGHSGALPPPAGQEWHYRRGGAAGADRRKAKRQLFSFHLSLCHLCCRANAIGCRLIST